MNESQPSVITSGVSETFLDKMRRLRTSAQERFLASFERTTDNSFDPEALSAEVTSMLNAERRGMVLKILGFTDKWGRMEIDNDRNSGSSHALRNYLQTTLEPIVSAWLEEHVRPVLEARGKNKLLSKQVQTSIENEFQRIYTYKLDEYVRALAEEMAREDAEAFNEFVRVNMSMDTTKHTV